ncbi:MAG: OmpA family protein [Candidatus Hydrogenedentes bacterium]|nr:OmpA family protein [Candidatus Hydrogenedentota bacterium]
MTKMKKLIVCAVGLTLALTWGTASAQGKIWDDLSWWGKSGATPAPYKDATRTGYWWWPTEPKSNANDSETWGNRGKVFHNVWAAEEVVKVTPPPPTPPPAPKRDVPVLNHILFDFDKYNLKPEGQAEANKVVDWMKQYGKDTLVIEGHTCDIGTDEYNMGLGQRRADSVKKYLVDNGVDAGRLEAKSFGESQPAVPNTSAANRKLNRRAVFKITIVD